MTLQELTDRDLSKWIAEKLEPNPGDYDDADWQARDMVNDPAMTLMLLEKLMASQFSTNLLLKNHRAVIETFELGRATYSSLPRAVAEAFALANGWTPNNE